MFIDVLRHLKGKSVNDWRTGNDCLYAFDGGHFFKCLREKPPISVHDYFISNKLNTNLTELSPTFEMYYYLTDADLRTLDPQFSTYRHVYIFQYVGFTEIKLFYKNRSVADVMPLLDDMGKLF